jgi:hypothetical protein
MRDEHRLGLLRNVFPPKKSKVTEYRRMRLVGHVERIEEKGGADTVLVGKYEGKSAWNT